MERFILWDHDGVLVDTEHWYYTATREALAGLGIDLSPSIYREIMINGRSSFELAEERGVPQDVVKAAIADRNRNYQQYIQTRDIEIAGVLPTLETLARSHRMAIVTTCRGPDFELIHRDRHILDHMEFVLVREDYQRSKPDPEPYLLAVQRFGASPEQVVVIEDSQRGLQSALRAGLECIIVHNSFTADHDFVGASSIIGGIAELPALLAQHRP